MAYYYDDTDPMSMYRNAMLARGGPARRFDEYYRCYPIVMMPGKEREAANHGGKLFLPASALDKLTQLHITYPMLFEISSGGHSTHAGVLEFTAEEGRCYLPYWIMQTLHLEPGDLMSIKSTDLPPGSFIKLQPQNTNFLDISDPKAVLETAFRNFSCLTVGDIFTFHYNETVYEIAVLEVKPSGTKNAISVQETDLEVDFAAPVGYVEPTSNRPSGANTPLTSKGGMLHTEGTMAQAINYSSIAPSASAAAVGASRAGSNFSGTGNKLVTKKGKGGGVATPASSASGAASPVSTTASIPLTGKSTAKRRNGPQPLRLPPGKLFFGYEIKPMKKKEGEEGESGEKDKKQHFSGEGNTLRKKK